jgi:hypothetical protein
MISSLIFFSLFRADSLGNLFVAGYQRIFKISASDSLVTTYVGNPALGSNAENMAASAVLLEYVRYISGDSLGNIYYIDPGKCRIRKVLAGSKLVSTVVGIGLCGFNGENIAALAIFLSSPSALWVDTAGNIIFGDDGNKRIRKFSVSTGFVTTIAGTGTNGFSDNLPATSAMFKSVYGIVGDTDGNIFFSDRYDYRVRKITNTGILVTYAGNGEFCCYGDSDNLPATSVRFTYPTGLQLDSNGNLYVSIMGRIILINRNTGFGSTIAGWGCHGNSGDGGPASLACISYADNFWIDSNSHCYFPQQPAYRIRKVASNIITTFAGTGFFAFSGDGGLAKNAQLHDPTGSFIDTNGNLYIADTNNCLIRRVNAASIISTVGGTGVCVFSGDNTLFSSTSIFTPRDIWQDTVGNLFVSTFYFVLRVAAASNIVTTIVGGGGSTAENIPATSYSLSTSWGLWGDTVNNLFIGDSGWCNVKKVSLSSSLIVTVAGTQECGFLDNVPATSGKLSYPYGIWVDTIGRLFIADSGNYRIRKVENGIITTFAGTGIYGFNGNGHLATATQLATPNAVIGDSNGNIYIADSNNHQVRMVSAFNNTANIATTVIGSSAGTVSRGWILATAAVLSYPQHITLDSTGAFYISEGSGGSINTIRKTVLLSAPTGQPTEQPTGQPTRQPIGRPTCRPSRQPTGQPTAQPKNAPSSQPSKQPSVTPSSQPSLQPTKQPSSKPSTQPSTRPTHRPTDQPSSRPSCQPSTHSPTNQPTETPSSQPSSLPSIVPSSQPSVMPTTVPSSNPSSQPSSQPTSFPTTQPSSVPSENPSSIPSNQPTGVPSTQPSLLPSSKPSSNPSGSPTFDPTGGSSGRPTEQPSGRPSCQPSSEPSQVPSSGPSSGPSDQPTSIPSGFPSGQPSSQPSNQPSAFPTNRPTCVPTSQPSGFPSSLPSSQPSVQPSSYPTGFPSSTPTFQPTVRIESDLKEAISGFYDIKDSLNDKSGNGNNGKAHGGISFTSDRFGSEKSSIEFDGKSGYIEVPTRNPDQLIANFTLSFWIYPNVSKLLPGTYVFDKSPYFENCWGWSLIYLKDRIFEFSYTIQHSERRLAVSSNISSSVLFDVSDSGWSHITIVKELRSLLAYRDGHLVNSTNIPLFVLLPYSSLPLVIGTSKEVLLRQNYTTTNHSSFYSGGLDDIFIYDRALSAGEIAQLREFSSPTSFPSGQPTTKPTVQPSSSPTRRPTSQPISFPSGIPTRRPSVFPSSQPTGAPSRLPSNQPTSCPSNGPTNRPTIRPSEQPSAFPSSQPVAMPSFVPSSQPSIQPTQQPVGRPSSAPSAQPLAAPTTFPSVQPSSRPTNQPTSLPSSQPSSQPTKNRFHCTVTDNKFYSPIRDDCIPCPLHSFLNHTGGDTCYCSGGYSQVGIGLTVNCTACSPGEVSFPGSSNCTQCQSGFFASSETNSCELCPVNFYSSDSSQIQCTPCPAGRATANLGSTTLEQCISPVPNFTLGFFSLFLVIMIFSWYIVFGKFQRVSFERKLKVVTPNIEKCKQVLLSEEEFHYQHLIVAQDKKNQRTRKFKFISFAVVSFVLMIVSVFLGFVFFLYHAFFTSLILWRGLKVDLNLSPILTLLADGLKDITDYIGLPVNLFYFVALPFLYLFETLATINLNLSSVNVTCAGSQAPIELLINCVILGLLVIIIRSDYQLLFNVLLNNLNQRFLLNNVEQRLDAGNFRFTRYFFACLVITALNAINPFQVGLRYCMGFVRIDTFGKNHGIAHEVSESCDQVPGAPHFDSFLGYMSTIFAWWLILPAIYCLAEVVVPKCKKIDPQMKHPTHQKWSTVAKIFPADLFMDESVKNATDGGKDIKDDVADEGNQYDGSHQDIGESDYVRLPEFPDRLSSKFPGVDETILAQVYREGCKEGVALEKGRKQQNDHENRVNKNASLSQKAVDNVTKRLPFVLAFYYYFKQKYFLMISVDLWVSTLFSSWITVLKKNTLKASRKEELLLLQHGGNQQRRMTRIISAKKSVKTPGVKQLFSLDSSEFIQQMHLYDLDQMKKQTKWIFCGRRNASKIITVCRRITNCV